MRLRVKEEVCVGDETCVEIRRGSGVNSTSQLLWSNDRRQSIGIIFGIE